MQSPETILKVAKNKGLDGIAITDHNTIKGGLEAYKINKDEDFDVIIGSEIETEYGDIIGLYLQDEISARSFIDVVEEIKAQNGLVILAHPYRKNILFPIKLIKNVDAIEIFNARSSKICNMKAKDLADRSKKPPCAGSDAHLSFEIGNGRTVSKLENDRISLKYNTVEGKISNYYFVHGMSVIIEQYKKRSKLSI
jgi:predicted metal-dependent phosphoesterase TrpH